MILGVFIYYFNIIKHPYLQRLFCKWKIYASELHLWTHTLALTILQPGMTLTWWLHLNAFHHMYASGVQFLHKIK